MYKTDTRALFLAEEVVAQVRHAMILRGASRLDLLVFWLVTHSLFSSQAHRHHMPPMYRVPRQGHAQVPMTSARQFDLLIVTLAEPHA